jgi:predicted PurR-regulated permease PerM
MPLIVGLCIAFVLNVPMRFFERRAFGVVTRRLPAGTRGAKIWNAAKRPLSLIVTLLLVFGIVTFVIVMIVPNLKDTIAALIDKAPEYAHAVGDWANGFLRNFGYKGDVKAVFGDHWKEIFGNVGKFLSGTGSEIAASAVGVASGVFSTVGNAVFGFVFALYILLTKDRLGRQTHRLLKAYVGRRQLAWIFGVARVARRIFAKFVAGQCIEAAIIGSLTAIGSLFINAKLAVMLGVVVGFTAFIPVIGAFLGVIIGALLLVMTSPLQAFAFIIFVILLQQFENHVIYPKVVGRSIGLPGMWVLLAVLVGGSVYGIFGIIIGVPLTSVIYAMLRTGVRRRLRKRREIHAKAKFWGSTEGTESPESHEHKATESFYR